MTVFLSYSWANTLQAEKIEEFLASFGVSVIRDVNSLEYRQNLRLFMSSIRKADYAVVLISNEYLKSPNCLYELVELHKEEEFIKKFLPILIDGTKIYSVSNKLEVIQHWRNKVAETYELIRDSEPTKVISIIQELKLYERIYHEIDSLLASISEYKNITFDDSNDSRFRDIIYFIGLDDKEVKEEISKIHKIESSELQDLAFEGLTLKYPNNFDISFTEGFINLTKRENYIKAQYYFEKCLQIKESHAVYNNLALALYNQGELHKAEVFFIKAVELESRYEVLSNLGDLEAKKQNYEKAIDYYLRSLEINPNNAVCYFNVGKIYTDMLDDFENGLKYYKRAIEIDPFLRQGYNNIGSIYFRQNDLKNASLFLEQAIGLNPKDFIAMNNLAGIYSAVGREKEAVALFRKAIRENQSYLSPKIGLAKLYITSGRNVEEGLELFKDVLKLDPAHPDKVLLVQIIEHFENKNYS